MSGLKTMYEFYYRIGDREPEVLYRLAVDRETSMMYYGKAIRIDDKGNELYERCRFRVYQDDTNEACLARSEKEPTIRVRVGEPNFEQAKKIASKMARDHLCELANRLYSEEMYKPDFPISIGEHLFKIGVEVMGCHACPHGHQVMRNQCPYKCPDNQFKIEEVIVDNIPSFIDMRADGSIVLRDYYFKTRELAEEAVRKKMKERKENKLLFDRFEKNRL